MKVNPPTPMKSKSNPLVSRPLASTAALCALAAFTIAGSASAATLLLSDNFDESSANEVAETFNSNLGATQSGSLATTTYTIGSGNSNAAQHSNAGNNLTVATFTDTRGFGRVSLNNNFATQANAADQPLEVSFNLGTVFGYATNTDRWVSFSIGSAQNQFITQDYVGVLFRAAGQTQTLNGGTQLGGTPNWTANDVVTIRLSGTGGTGSAFSTNGTEATISIGANNIGTFDIGQRADAFMTFSVINDTSEFGGGNFDNLNVTLIPEPSAALFGGLGLLALLRRRRA